MRTKTIDLAREMERLQEDVAELEDAQRDLAEKAREEYGGYESVPDSVERKFNELEQARIEHQGRLNAVSDICDKHDDVTFVIRELSGGSIANIQDQINEASFDFDVETQHAEGVPKAGYGQVLWVRESVVQCPDWVKPSPGEGLNNDPANLPWKVFEVLSEVVNNFNTVGDADLGNSSLREAMSSDS